MYYFCDRPFIIFIFLLLEALDCAGTDRSTAPNRDEASILRASRCFLQLDFAQGGPCGHCGARTSSAWRKGPVGKEDLCNQCGARYIQKGTLHGFFPNQRDCSKPGVDFRSPGGNRAGHVQ